MLKPGLPPLRGPPGLRRGSVWAWRTPLPSLWTGAGRLSAPMRPPRASYPASRAPPLTAAPAEISTTPLSKVEVLSLRTIVLLVILACNRKRNETCLSLFLACLPAGNQRRYYTTGKACAGTSTLGPHRRRGKTCAGMWTSRGNEFLRRGH